jgi:hypothetical protein
MEWSSKGIAVHFASNNRTAPAATGVAGGIAADV